LIGQSCNDIDYSAPVLIEEGYAFAEIIFCDGLLMLPILIWTIFSKGNDEII
jgi:hypothetical protein